MASPVIDAIVETVARHERQALLSLRPGPAGAGCSCGWHSHDQTYRDHLTDILTNGET